MRVARAVSREERRTGVLTVPGSSFSAFLLEQFVAVAVSRYSSVLRPFAALYPGIPHDSERACRLLKAGAMERPLCPCVRGAAGQWLRY